MSLTRIFIIDAFLKRRGHLVLVKDKKTQGISNVFSCTLRRINNTLLSQYKISSVEKTTHVRTKKKYIYIEEEEEEVENFLPTRDVNH